MSGKTSGRHLGPDELFDYTEGHLSEEQALRVGEHLGECDDCVERASRARSTALFLENWTARQHGATYARSEGRWREVILEWLGELLWPERLEVAYAADSTRSSVDAALARVPALVGDAQGARKTEIDVVQAPTVSESGSLVIGLRIPQDLGEAPQEFELELLSSSDPQPIGAPVEVTPGCHCVASFELSDQLRRQWSNLEEQEPRSWPFRFAIRIRRAITEDS